MIQLSCEATCSRQPPIKLRLLPLLVRKPYAILANVLRLWGVVLVANLVGALLFALVVGLTNVFDADTRHAFGERGIKAVEPGFASVMLRGVFAGWLIALMVWLLPFAETARVWVIILLTYLIGIGHLSHVIAGATEVFTIAAIGQLCWVSAVAGFYPARTRRQHHWRSRARRNAQSRAGSQRRRGLKVISRLVKHFETSETAETVKRRSASAANWFN